MTIRELDDATIGQIAAGEVVERPLSVVKELVENALDAGARRIDIEIVGGGIERIVVADDGWGIAAGELPLALARHATSKLRNAGDLAAIATLGFRGEGLASIAAVARLRLISRTLHDEIGHALEVDAGRIASVGPVAAPVGTRVDVCDLFAAVPVRREYLRAPAAEFARISAFVGTLALGYPQTGFSVTHDGRRAFAFGAGAAFEERLSHAFGGMWSHLIPLLETTDGRATVGGYISRPGFDRPDRRQQQLFVNRRLLRSTLFAGAWSAGYSGYAMTQRQPFGVLFVQVPVDEVDPNVHPTKSDVRLRRDAAVLELVRRAIRTTLARDAGERIDRSLSLSPPSTARELPASADAAISPLRLALDGSAGESEPIQPLRILAQLDDTYILATDGRALVLVDQHAAHERIAYETIARRADGAVPSEPLLVPYAVELSATDAARLEASRSALAAGGLEIEPFGERVYRIVATPAGYGARAFDLRGYLVDLADDVPGLSARERIWATLACHSVVRAGDRLEHAEMAALLLQLERCRNPMHCPHGRPTVVRIEPDEVARRFRRL